MYLNVNLTPSSNKTGPGIIPKTPEILNSLLSIATTPLSPSYNSYHHQVNTGDLLSPTSSTTSPYDEVSATQFGSQSTPRLSSNSSDPGGGGCILTTRVSGVFQGCLASSIAGTPSPPMSELLSPVMSLEATKSALIKEGLKHQIQVKMQAAGKDNLNLPDPMTIKEENSDSSENLTPQDEERRYRRRERNKIAATKCRNKKKEKTITLMTESESVEDQNIRLKSEIQRLTCERKKLEKLLEDPCHVASCRRSTSAPLVIVSSPGTPELLSSPSTSVNRSFASSGMSSVHVSEQSSITECLPSYCAVSSGSSYEANFASSSFPNLSPCSIPSVSPNPHVALQQHSPQLTSLSAQENCSSTLSESSTSRMTHISLSNQVQVTSYQQADPKFSPIKTTQQVMQHNHHDQQYSATNIRHTTPPNHFQSRQLSPYSGQCSGSYSNTSGQCSSSNVHHNVADYIPLPQSEKSYYDYESSAALLLTTDTLPEDGTQTKSSGSNIGKIRTALASCNRVRYSPYNHMNQSSNTSVLSHASDITPVQNLQTDPNNSGMFLINQYDISEGTQNNPFFPSYTYGNI